MVKEMYTRTELLDIVCKVVRFAHCKDTYNNFRDLGMRDEILKEWEFTRTEIATELKNIHKIDIEDWTKGMFC